MGTESKWICVLLVLDQQMCKRCIGHLKLLILWDSLRKTFLKMVCRLHIAMLVKMSKLV